MEESRFFMIKDKSLPEVFHKVLTAKEMIYTGKAKDISEATKAVGISRSTYYKYKDDIFPMSQEVNSKKATLVVSLIHGSGNLSKVVDCIVFNKGNLMTINQDIPINGIANVTITLETLKLRKDIDQLANIIAALPNVVDVKILSREQ